LNNFMSKSKGPAAGATGPEAGAKGPEAGAKRPEAGANGPKAGANGPKAGANGPKAWAKGPEAGAKGPDAGAKGPRDERDFSPQAADLSLAALFVGWALADEVQRRIAADGLADLRMADGVLFQHLVAGPRTIGSLAERLGVTQQAASKAVADLERRGYVRREADPADGRARRVALTARGEAAIAAGRRHRAALEAELADRLGPRRVESARRTLVEILEALGGSDAVRRRRVRPPA
jgi:DNA-binding MarR family transcriptional regulator